MSHSATEQRWTNRKKNNEMRRWQRPDFNHNNAISLVWCVCFFHIRLYFSFGAFGIVQHTLNTITSCVKYSRTHALLFVFQIRTHSADRHLWPPDRLSVSVCSPAPSSIRRNHQLLSLLLPAIMRSHIFVYILSYTQMNIRRVFFSAHCWLIVHALKGMNYSLRPVKRTNVRGHLTGRNAPTRTQSEWPQTETETKNKPTSHWPKRYSLTFARTNAARQYQVWMALFTCYPYGARFCRAWLRYLHNHVNWRCACLHAFTLCI